MRKSNLFILTLFLTSFLNLQGQSLPDIELYGVLCCNLNSVFENLSQKYNLKFKYNVKQMESIKYNDHAYKLTLAKFLEKVCNNNTLRYFIEMDGTINIVDRWVNPQEKVIFAQKEYFGQPTKSDFTLAGKVIDKANRESLPYVNIGIKGSTIGTSSNVDGYFKLLHVPSDTVTIQFSYIGYKSRELYLTPSIDTKDLLFELETAAIKLNEVKVTTENTELLQISGNQVSMIKMSPVNLYTLPNLGEKDILRSMQLMPGISAANENSSGLYVRGGTPDQSLVLYDGFTVYNVEHLFGFFSVFNSNTIKDIQLFKGGFDVKYGGRLSSVAEITGKEGNRKKFNLVADLSLMSVNSFVEFPIGDEISAIFGVRRSWESPIYNKIFEQFANQDDTPAIGRFGNSENQTTTSYFYDVTVSL